MTYLPVIGVDAKTRNGMRATVSKIEKGFSVHLYPFRVHVKTGHTIHAYSVNKDGGQFFSHETPWDLIGPWDQKPNAQVGDTLITRKTNVVIAVKDGRAGILRGKDGIWYPRDEDIIEIIRADLKEGDRVKGENDVLGTVESKIVKGRVLMNWDNGQVNSAFVDRLTRV